MIKLNTYPNLHSNPTRGEYTMRAEVLKKEENGYIRGNINYYKVHNGWLDMVDDNVDDEYVRNYTNNFYPSFIKRKVRGRKQLINNAKSLKDQLIEFLQSEFDGIELYDADDNKCYSFMKNDEVRTDFFSDNILTPQEALKNSLEESEKNTNKMKNYINN